MADKKKVSEAEALEHYKLTGHNDLGYEDPSADEEPGEGAIRVSHFEKGRVAPEKAEHTAGAALAAGRPDLRGNESVNAANAESEDK